MSDELSAAREECELAKLQCKEKNATYTELMEKRKELDKVITVAVRELTAALREELRLKKEVKRLSEKGVAKPAAAKQATSCSRK